MAYDGESYDRLRAQRVTQDQLLQELVIARELLERGWNQRWFQRQNERGGTSYCLLGALREASEQVENIGSLQTGLAEDFALSNPPRFLGWPMFVHRWNDRPWRRQSDVLRYIDGLIRLRQKAVIA